MGWSEGKGLGANENGMTEHVKIKKKSDNSGIGVDASTNSKAWISNSLDYTSILANLNQAYAVVPPSKSATKTKKQITTPTNSNTEISLTTKTEETILHGKKKGGLIYKKAIIAKSVRRYSELDMRAIMGGIPYTPLNNNNNVKTEEQVMHVQEEEEEDDEEDEPSVSPLHHIPTSPPEVPTLNNALIEPTVGLVTTTSTYSVNDYFKQRMATLQKNQQSQQINKDDSSNNFECEKKIEDKTSSPKKLSKKKKTNKRKRNEIKDIDSTMTVDTTVSSSLKKEQEQPTKKKKKIIESDSTTNKKNNKLKKKEKEKKNNKKSNKNNKINDANDNKKLKKKKNKKNKKC